MKMNCPLECGLRISSFYAHHKKCKRSELLGREYIKCANNYLHIVKKCEYEEHLKNCPNKNVSGQEEAGFSDSDSDGFPDLDKILNKASKFSKHVKRNSDFEDDQVEEKIEKIKNKNSAYFENEEEIDEDSKQFYQFVYGIK